MYYDNISNTELQYFRNLMVSNFTIKLSDVLTSDLFKIEEIVADKFYKIYPLFYTNTITSSNNMDRILDNRCIICQKQDDKETYLTFISDENADIQDYQNYAEYFDITDSLTVKQYNMVVSLLRQNTIHTDNFNIMEEADGSYGKYLFNVDGCTIIDAGIIIDDETRQSVPKVKLMNNVFHYSTYTLKLRVMHYTGVNILDDISPSNFIVVDTMELELLPDEWITIPLTDLQDGYIISIHTNVEIKHDKPVISDLIQSLEVKSEPTIIQKNETAEFYATGLDNGKMPVREGHTIHFFEKIEPVITVSSTPSIIQSSENSEIYAKVKDNDGSLAQDVKVHFYRQSKHLFEYKGVGGTEEDSFVCQTGASLTPSSSGTVFSASGGTGFAWANKYGTGSDWDKGDWVGDFTIECDVISTDGNGRISIYERYKTGALFQAFTVGVGRNKIVKTGNTCTHYINDVQQGNPVTKTMEEPFRIGLITNDGTTVKFKKFIID